MQLSPYGLLLLSKPLHSSEQHIRANLEFSSNFGPLVQYHLVNKYYKGLIAGIAKSSIRKLSKVALLACERQTSLGETFINHGLKTPLDDDHR